MTDLAIGIDLGGTNLRAAAFRGLAYACDHPAATASAVKPVIDHRELVGEPRTPEVIVERIGALVDRLASEVGGAPDTPVGIGFAGMLRGDEGLVVNSPHLRWRNVEFGAMLRERLGHRRRIVIENDVNAITWGELRLGAGRGSRDLLAVFVGTGVGGGIVAEGQLVRGGTGCAAEIGHSKVKWDAGAWPCACGKAGCVEAYLSGIGLLKRAKADLGGGMKSSAIELAGGVDAVNPGHLDAAAAAGDPYAVALWREVAPLLGVVLANAVTLLNPAVLVLGGGVLSRTPVLRAHVLEAFQRTVNASAAEGLAIVDSALGDDAGLVGSALLALSPEPL